MTLSTRTFLILTLSISALGAEPARIAADPALTIRIYDYADTDARLLDRALKQTADILDQAGISPVWEGCSPRDADSSAGCSTGSGPNVIQFRIHPSEMAKKLTKRSVEFGYSLPLENGHGIIGGVYLERTLREAGEIGLDAHVMLGHTIAHEIGHLLLGTNSHARRGIMSPTWTKREVRLAQTGVFNFTKDQARRIRGAVDDRIQIASR